MRKSLDVVLLLLLLLLEGEAATVPDRFPVDWEEARAPAASTVRGVVVASDDAAEQTMRMRLCGGHCDTNCVDFVTPVNECFNGRDMFPEHADAWGEFDVYDLYWEFGELPEGTKPEFNRYFFSTKDSTCGGNKGAARFDQTVSTDGFSIPFETCVGPFGQPRPWGEFRLVDSSDEQRTVAHATA